MSTKKHLKNHLHLNHTASLLNMQIPGHHFGLNKLVFLGTGPQHVYFQ